MSSDLPEFPREWSRAAARVAGWLWRTVQLRDGRPVDHSVKGIASAMSKNDEKRASIATVHRGLRVIRAAGWLVEEGGDEAAGIPPKRSILVPGTGCQNTPDTRCQNDGLTPGVNSETDTRYDTRYDRGCDTRSEHADTVDVTQARACARSESQSLRDSDGPIGRTDSDDPEPETTTLPSNLQGTTQTPQRAGARATPAIGRFDKTPAQRPHVPGSDPDIHPKAEAVDRCIRYHHPRLIPNAGPDAYQILRELDVLYQRAPEAIEAFRFWRPFDGAAKPIAVLLSDIRKCRPGEILTDRAERWRLFLTAPLAWCNEWVAKIQPQAAVAVLDLEWTEDDVRDAITDHRARRRLEAPEDPPTQSDGPDVLSPEEEAAEAAAVARWHASSEALRIRLGIPAPPPKPAGPPKEILRPRGWHP